MSDDKWYGENYVAGRGWTGVLCGERGWYLKEGGQGWSSLRDRPLSKDLKE